jgi:hypothetical protein
MAFSTSNVAVGNNGNRRVLTGNWSCLATDAPGTIVIGSGYVSSFDFDPAVTSGPAEKPLVSASVSSGQTTLTVNHHQTVTNGKFRVEY